MSKQSMRSSSLKTRGSSLIVLVETLKAVANEDTMLRTQMFPPFARARNICCGHKICVRDTKMFLISFRNICVRNKCFPVCAA